MKQEGFSSTGYNKRKNQVQEVAKTNGLTKLKKINKKDHTNYTMLFIHEVVTTKSVGDPQTSPSKNTKTSIRLITLLTLRIETKLEA